MKNYVKEIFRTVIMIVLMFDVLLLFFPLIRHNAGIGMLDSVQHISIQGIASIDGGPYQEIKDSMWENGIRRTLEVIGSFDHSITNGNSLILWPRNLRIKLYVNGMLTLSAGQRESFPDFIQYAGNSYQIFYIGSVSPHDTVRLEIEKAYESCRINVITEFFENLYVGREGAVYQSIFKNEIIQPLIGLILLLIGILFLTATLFQRFTQFKHMRQVYFLGWFYVIGGIAYICDSSYEFIDLLIPHPVFNTLVDLCSIPALLIFYLLYVTSAARTRRSKLLLHWITAIFIILETVPFVLQLAGIQDLHVIQDQFVYFGVIAIACSLCPILCEIFIQNNMEMRKVLMTALPLMIGLFLKLGNILLEHGIERSFLRMGILISCLLLLNNTFKYISRSMQLVEQEQQMKQEIQNAQISIMLSQIQPHFLYNALNTLEHICIKDGVLAANAIQHFASYLRGNMESLTTDRPIPFEKELEHVKHYLYLETLRFGERIRVEYDLDYTCFNLPTLTLQPIVENAIRHGITKQAEGGLIQIATRQYQDEIWITVTDNGAGFDSTSHLKDNRRHIGIENVKKRLELQCNGTIDIISQKELGTKVTIRLKGAGIRKDESHGR